MQPERRHGHPIECWPCVDAIRELSGDGCLSTNTKYQQLELTAARRLQSAMLGKTLIRDNPLAFGLCGRNSDGMFSIWWSLGIIRVDKVK